MSVSTPSVRSLRLVAAGLLAPALFLSLPLVAADQCVEQKDLVVDVAVANLTVDPGLVNAWGVALVPGGPIWVADNHSGKATSYDGDGVAQPGTITIPAAGSGGTGSPTGVVLNTTPGFVEDNLVPGPAPATLLFASEDGAITAWNGALDGSTARVVADRSGAGAIYKGIAIANNGAANFLYATDFHNGRVDVFDATFAPATAPGGFTDPTLPRGYAPFGIQNVGGVLYVTYAKQDADKEDDVPGRSAGIVNAFDANGFRLRRFATRGHLNAPWGVALEPTELGSRLLIANFGDGWVNSFDLRTGRFAGALRKTDGRPVAIDGLWGIAFGDGATGRPRNALFFAAGPADEAHGLFGRLDPAACLRNRK